MSNKFGKPFADELVTGGWKKKSIFFELPYWKSLYVRHFLDVMHIEKNVFESVIGTLLNIPGKSKDSINARDVHWALLVIDPDAGIIYFLDPMDIDSSRYLICKNRFENALLIYRAYNQTKPVPSSNSNRIKWIRIKCPQQTNTTDCGYFVSRFMKEIVMKYPKKISDNYFDEYNGTYSKDKLDEMKDD
ncbi:hypothetical protein TSUD_26670 [Trifolium subterraneum]|uniref:Ubiquitin-like protease family profile domain-containing protein n=1 Tax=Trifolium subterraneum TaxID=3900 RepID=A0A2Z6M7Q7_TRISU|nr:hypothetical protein TSUD_26670 [Trifolium subterraneum]